MRSHCAGRIVAILASVLGTGVLAGQAPLQAMAGRWEGDAHIVVNWTVQRTLSVVLMIDSAGRVSGSIGDATLFDGQLRSNRGWLGRTLHVKTDYIVEGKLRGPVIAAERVSRDIIRMPLNWTGDTFTGGLATSGWVAGGPKHMVFTANRLVLRRR